MAEENNDTTGVGMTLREIITDDRIMALSNINRWRGYTNRQYSVLEHTVVGISVMHLQGHKYSKYQQRRFALHDIHESEFIGDVPAPDIVKYCNSDYHADVRAFDKKLLKAAGITKVAHLSCPESDVMDMTIRTAEHEVLVPFDFGYRPTPGCQEHAAAVNFIKTGEYRGNLAIDAFHYHMSRLWPEWEL